MAPRDVGRWGGGIRTGGSRGRAPWRGFGGGAPITIPAKPTLIHILPPAQLWGSRRQPSEARVGGSGFKKGFKEGFRAPDGKFDSGFQGLTSEVIHKCTCYPAQVHVLSRTSARAIPHPARAIPHKCTCYPAQVHVLSRVQMFRYGRPQEVDLAQLGHS